MNTFIFFAAAAIAISASILVITQRNPIASVMYLVTSFVAQVVLFIKLSAAFLAMLQIIVYAGAILVLFLFVIMLLNLRREDFGRDIKLRYKPVAVAFAIVMLLQVIVIVDSSEIVKQAGASLPADFGSVKAVGIELFTNYLYPFELTSVLLIVAVLGAVVMAKRSL